MSVFSRKLQDVLDREGLSQHDFGRMLGTHQQNVERWVNGKAVPRWPNVKLIAQTLGEPIDEWRAAWQEAQEAEPKRSDSADARELAAIQARLDRIQKQVDDLRRRGG